MKILSIVIISLLVWLCVTLFYDSYYFAQQACFAWSAKISISCSIDFIHAGLIQSLSHNLILATFFSGETVSVQPNSYLGNLIVVGFAIIIVILLFAIFRTYKLFFTKELNNKISFKVPNRVLDFYIFAFIVIIAGAVGFNYFSKINQQPADLNIHGLTLSPSPGKSTSDPNVVINISEEIIRGAITDLDLERIVKSLIQNNKIDGHGISILFQNSLGSCRGDYAKILLKFPIQNHPKDYDPAYMQSNYSSVTSLGCENIYKLMGWSKGCEVDLKLDPCAEFTDKQQHYFSLFAKNISPESLNCTSDSDCYQSEKGKCGITKVISKNAFSTQELEIEKSKRCPLKKTFSLCAKKDPGFLHCNKFENQFPKCINSTCKLESL